jgi:serine/threonine protein kinase
MAAPCTVDELLELIRKSGVVDSERLSAYVEKPRAKRESCAEPQEFAKMLVDGGIITKFQSEQYLMGKWRRFTIGNYAVLEKLGSGFEGSVYLCRSKSSRELVAVKILPSPSQTRPVSVERFMQECRLLSQMNHANIVRFHETGCSDGLHFLSMEFVDGCSLQSTVGRKGPMDVARAAHYVKQAALGIQHIHSHGIAHRAIRPSDILVNSDGVAKIIDMGQADYFEALGRRTVKRYGFRSAFDFDRSHELGYLAPEQTRESSGGDARSDIYGLGATCYFCLTARAPFGSAHGREKLTSIR